MSATTTAVPGSTVVVTGISKSTAKKQVDDFFSFCGSISSLELKDDGVSQTATVEFAKPSAASTAVMLHGSSLDGATIDVRLAGNASSATAAATAAAHDDTPAVNQEDKPKTAIVAEYLAHGYKISDDITKRAIELDNKHGLSTKFKGYLTQLDRSLGERLEKSQAGHAAATTSRTEHSPSGPAALSSATEKEAAAMPVPGTDASVEGPKTTTTIPTDAAGGASQQPSLARQVQQNVNAVLEKPEVKSKTDLAWSKLSEYYNAIVNHPRIHAFYTQTSKTVNDVHEEAKRIAEQKKAGGSGGAAGTSAPAHTSAAGTQQMSVSWVLLALLFFSSLSLQTASAHEQGEHPAHAEIAGYKNKDGEESYIQQHMASEHHIGAFNMGSFYALHDLNRDGILDRSEIEAIYGVHHPESKKHSPSQETHADKADAIVKAVLERIDKNGDGVITKQEFIAAGPNGLPAFEQYGKNALGHHYDEESEFFVHHEEIYHNTPETQADEAYTHKEDLDHFAKHEKIEEEEERRERHAEGLPTIEEDKRLRKEAEAKGLKYESPYDKQLSDVEQKKAQAAHDEAQLGNAVKEAEADEHTFKTPGGVHVVHEKPIQFQQQEVDNKGRPAHPNSGHADGALPQGVADRLPGETDEGRRQRLQALKEDAAKRPAYGQGQKGFAYPKDDTDRMRKGTPYKYRVKKQSYFGEF
ncbi:uncharacterized protein PFL1_06205 [Pseudozyma flocculosa PF-1]|uniref:RRM domain-containing protein n=1 Tax=Pseudozyma flocculosa PF-1 TaxID=1277687 RepID=A0A061H344_9BASI|nr:uncharacterized protein PFL1_06205 [Pseudozyma flocculosa PF-1]EPQ26270.1 hypothetical protein PFL1_06205 [Pseudozyma flocculosa PF-1]